MLTDAFFEGLGSFEDDYIEIADFAFGLESVSAIRDEIGFFGGHKGDGGRTGKSA